MSTQVKRRRGTAAENAAFTGALAELVYLTDSKRLALHDAVAAGGFLIPNALDALLGAMTRATATGTDTYAITLPYFPTSYSAGLEIDVTFTNANTGTSTLNVNGVGAAGMKDETGTNFTAGQISAGSRFTFRHNGTEWRRVSGAAGAIRSVVKQVFTASGTYTPTAGMLFCVVEVIGGGGGGGFNSGSGGGSGGYSLRRLTAAQIGASQVVTIGAAGAGGVFSTSTPATAGGNSSLGSFAVANGGGGGATAGAGGAGTATYGAGASGGTASSGDLNISGGGSSMVFAVSSSPNLRFASNGANSFLGGGGRSVSGADGQAAAANSGSGGGGGGQSSNGGAGGAGFIIITEYCSQ